MEVSRRVDADAWFGILEELRERAGRGGLVSPIDAWQTSPWWLAAVMAGNLRIAEAQK